VPASTSTSTPSSSGGGSNAGAIAGGVIGGLAAIAIIIFLVWWFVIRKRRQAQAAAAAQQENSIRHERSRSMQSIASTVLTRASNVIQIAYIPGVTNRSGPETPGTLVPPVPPIPSTHVTSNYSGDQYLFTPSDLRDSRYSNATNDRRSIATSLARSSVATTIYRNDAIVSPMPALQARAGKAAMVSVKTGNSTPSDELSLNTIEAPAVPAITEAQLQKAGRVKPQLSSIVARSVVARPVNVKGSKPKVIPTVTEEVDSDGTESVASHTRAKRFNNQDSKFDDSSDEEGSDDEKGEAIADSIQIGISASTNEGPFADANAASTPTVTVSNSTAPSTPATEAVSSRASIASNRMLENTIYQDPTTERSASPFDDKHEVK
jgi:protein OPY2